MKWINYFIIWSIFWRVTFNIWLYETPWFYSQFSWLLISKMCLSMSKICLLTSEIYLHCIFIHYPVCRIAYLLIMWLNTSEYAIYKHTIEMVSKIGFAVPTLRPLSCELMLHFSGGFQINIQIKPVSGLTESNIMLRQPFNVVLFSLFFFSLIKLVLKPLPDVSVWTGNKWWERPADTKTAQLSSSVLIMR